MYECIYPPLMGFEPTASELEVQRARPLHQKGLCVKNRITSFQ